MDRGTCTDTCDSDCIVYVHILYQEAAFWKIYFINI